MNFMNGHTNGHHRTNGDTRPIAPAGAPQDKIRAIDEDDWTPYQHLLVRGKTLADFDHDDLRTLADRFADTQSLDTIPAGWPTGGLWIGERDGEVRCAVRVITCPDRAILRRAVCDRDSDPALLAHLVNLAIQQCQSRNFGSICIGKDVSPAQASSLFEPDRWSTETRPDAVTFHLIDGESTLANPLSLVRTLMPRRSVS